MRERVITDRHDTGRQSIYPASAMDLLSAGGWTTLMAAFIFVFGLAVLAGAGVGFILGDRGQLP